MLSARDEKFLHSMQPVFQTWYLGDIIGEGSSGTVYKITDNNGNTCALKVIPVTIDDEVNTISFKEQDPVSKRKYLNDMTSEILAEVKVMKILEHHGGIVKYHEYDVLKATDSFVHLILIRMDLLTPLNKVLRMRDTEFSPKEIATIGMDVLTALSECRKHNIIHRDIKPSNIFVTKDNRYLLGDFGSARLMERTMMASHKGTLCYMAPEIAAGQTFNSTVDIYSLGIMLYQLLNNRKLPFLNDTFKFSDIESAVEKRLSGAPLPLPQNADNTLGKIICKMCAYSPKDRYATPDDCLNDFKNYMKYGDKKNRTNNTIRLSKVCVLLVVLLPLIAVTLTITLKIKNNVNTNILPEKTSSGNSISTETINAVTGISSGNVNSSGMIASDEKWLYYSQDNMEGGRGIRVSKDGQHQEKLCDYIMNDINSTTDYLFFSSQYTSPDTSRTPTFITGLYRMNKDGSNLSCLDDGNISNPVAYGNYVYYFKTENDNNILCRIPFQGGKTETLAKFDNFTSRFYPYEDQLYIYDNGAAQLIALNIDDGTKTIIANEVLRNFCIEGGILYYSPPCADGFNNKIYVHKMTSKSPTAIITDNEKMITFPYAIYEFNVSNGVIYASSNMSASSKNQSGKDGIWRVNNDGSALKQIYTGNATSLQLIDQTLYFVENMVIHTMDLNGENVTTTNAISSFYMLD